MTLFDAFCSWLEIITDGLKLAKHDGILYLGTCNPEYAGSNATIQYTADKLFQYRRGSYYCTHAVAYTKRRARTIWGDFAAYKFLHHEIGADTIARQWQILSKNYPISAAQNIQWPPGSGHFGLFYQDRDRFSSTL